MTARFIVTDVFDGLATLEDGSVDVVISSPPFLALRSYLPSDHPDKSKEIGSESTPAEFLDVLLRVTAELRRVLAPHGSICIELGDTYAGSGGAGGDYNDGSLREGQTKFDGSMKYARTHDPAKGPPIPRVSGTAGGGGGHGWPLAKSKTLIPELYRIALAYGINPLTGQESPAGRWRIRNVVTWARPNPPVGALGDKWRPATSDVVVACVSDRRYWDDIATRRTAEKPILGGVSKGNLNGTDERRRGVGETRHMTASHSAGAPLLDYWEIPLLDGEEPKRYGPGEKVKKGDPKVGEQDRSMPELLNHGGHMGTSEHGAPLLDYWEIPPGGYPGSHYAVFPAALVEPLVKAMAPPKVCQTCGEPSRRIVENPNAGTGRNAWNGSVGESGFGDRPNNAERITLGWTECPCPDPVTPSVYDGIEEPGSSRPSAVLGNGSMGNTPGSSASKWRPALVLDPFAGSGTTLRVATGHGHDAVGIDLDSRNVALARDRIGPFLFELVNDEPWSETNRSDNPLLAQGPEGGR